MNDSFPEFVGAIVIVLGLFALFGSLSSIPFHTSWNREIDVDQVLHVMTYCNENEGTRSISQDLENYDLICNNGAEFNFKKEDLNKE